MPDLPVVTDSKSWLLAVARRPYRVLTAVLLISLFFAFYLKDLRFQTSIYDLTIRDLPETIQYEDFKQEFGTEEIILVVVKAQDVFSDATFSEIKSLSERLKEVKGIRRVVSLPEIQKAMDITGKWSTHDFKSIIAPVGLLTKNLVSEDGTACAITLVLEDGGEKAAVVEETERILKDHSSRLSLYQIGMPVVSKALADRTLTDFLVLPPLALLTISIALFFLLRDPIGLFAALSSVLLALIWTFGLMGFTDTPLSMVTMIVPVFLVAVGTAYCLYIVAEYRHVSSEEEDTVRAVYKCISQISFPTLLAVVTTVIGLGSLLLNRITAIREFALFSCFGIVSMLVLVLTYLPAIFAIIRPKGILDKKKRGSLEPFFDLLSSKIASVNLNNQKLLITCVAAIFVAGAAGLPRLKVETNPIAFFKDDDPISRNFHDIYKDLAGSFPINIVLDSNQPDFFENPLNLKLLEKVQEALGAIRGVDKAVSFSDYLKLVNYSSSQFMPGAYSLPKEPFEVRMLINSFKIMLGDDLLKGFVSRDFSKANLLLRTRLSGSGDFLEARKAIAVALAPVLPPGVSTRITGFGIVISQSSSLLTTGQVKSLSLTLALIFIIMLALFLSFKVGLISMIPNIFPIVVNFGFMGWAGIPLSTATSLIAGIAIGLAVDDTIHYLFRYNKEFKKDLDKRRALRDTVCHMGRPMITTTLTLALGFSVLMASGFRPTSTFGLLIVITMCSALLADLFLLPSLMLHVELVTVWDLIRVKLGKPPDEGILIFQGLSRSQVYYILMAGGLKLFREGDTVFRKGDKGDSMYAVISGGLEVVDFSENSNTCEARRLISAIGVGDIVGEMAMFRASSRSATVLASTDTELLEINERMLKRLNWLYPPTAQKFFVNLIRILCNRLEIFTNRCLELTLTDHLTGLGNIHLFEQTMTNERARSSRYGDPLSLLVLRLEDITTSSGKTGHQISDMVMADASGLVRSNLRETDYIFRTDDLTFACILVKCKEKEASDTCERLTRLISEHEFLFGDTPVSLSLRSCWGPALPEEHLRPKEMIDRLLLAGTNLVNSKADSF